MVNIFRTISAKIMNLNLVCHCVSYWIVVERAWFYYFEVWSYWVMFYSYVVTY